MTEPRRPDGPVHACATCAKNPGCSLLRFLPDQSESLGLTGVPLPMPCGGREWEYKQTANRRFSRKLGANLSGKLREDDTPMRRGTLDDLNP